LIGELARPRWTTVAVAVSALRAAVPQQDIGNLARQLKRTAAGGHRRRACEQKQPKTTTEKTGQKKNIPGQNQAKLGQV